MGYLLETLLEETFATVKRARNSFQRQYQFPKADNMIKVAVGMRRTGKTYFLYQTINKLLEEGVTQEQILMINFEDDRLLPMTAKEMGALLDSFFSLYPANHERGCYLFLDEVQNVKDWHRVVRRYFDSKQVQLYLTGSSSKLLSKEINTSLRGRSLALEIGPYSFSEYLAAQHITPERPPFGQKSFDIMQGYLKNYFSSGGFPAVQNLFESEWRETLQGYIDTVILRDIVERHNVANIVLLKYLITTLLNSAAAPFSVNKFYNDIKSQGYKAGKETIHNYLEYIQDAFLVFSVPIYSESVRRKQNTPKKIYAIDSGLIKAVSTNIHGNDGRLLENLVYLDLRRQNKKIYFYHTRDGYEVDFMTVDDKGAPELIQVVWGLDEKKVEARERRALLQAEEELGIKGKIITAREYVAHSCSA